MNFPSSLIGGAVGVFCIFCFVILYAIRKLSVKARLGVFILLLSMVAMTLLAGLWLGGIGGQARRFYEREAFIGILRSSSSLVDMGQEMQVETAFQSFLTGPDKVGSPMSPTKETFQGDLITLRNRLDDLLESQMTDRETGK